MKKRLNILAILQICGCFAVILSIILTAHASAVRPAPVSLSLNGQLQGGTYREGPGATFELPHTTVLNDSTPDGNLVVFTSTAAAENFVTDAVEAQFQSFIEDVFIRNIQTGETICVSCSVLQGVLQTTGGKNARLSANGRYVVYESLIFEVLGIPRPQQIYRFDLQTRETQLVSESVTAMPGNNQSTRPVVSADGRYVAFLTLATDLIFGYPPSTNTRQLFVRDMQTGSKHLASHAAGLPNQPGNQEVDSTQPISISDNGRFTVWTSRASNYLTFSTDTNNVNDVFFFDVISSGANIGAASLIPSGAATGNGASFGGIIASESGSFPLKIVFASQATNLSPADPFSNTDIYLTTGSTPQVVSLASTGAAANASSGDYAAISRNGRFIAFVSAASNLDADVSEPTTITDDVFLRDMQTGVTRYASLNAAGFPAGGTLSPVAISASYFLNRRVSNDGRYVAFYSTAPLSVRDNGGTNDLYVRDLTAGVSILATLNNSANGGQSAAGSAILNDPTLSADGRTVIFTTGSTNLFPNDPTSSGNLKIFLSKISLLSSRPSSDFSGDFKNDFAVWRPSEGNWYSLFDAGGGGYTSVLFGENGNRIAPGDYDGDSRTDYAVFIPAFGRWDILQSSDNSVVTKFFGTANDILTPADFDGDGRTDPAYFRPANGTWYILQSNTNSLRSVKFGLNGDVPTVGDYDGDNRADIAIFRPSSGDWWILRSSNNSFYGFHWGISTDKPVVGDFDGDGKSDAAVFRAGVWYILSSRDENYRILQWGLSTDRVAVSDYDGDGKTDIAVFRPSDGCWYVLQSSNDSLSAVQWGIEGDVPVAAAYIP